VKLSGLPQIYLSFSARGARRGGFALLALLETTPLDDQKSGIPAGHSVSSPPKSSPGLVDLPAEGAVREEGRGIYLSIRERGRDREIESPLYIYKYKNRSNRSIYLSIPLKSLRINSFRK